MKIVSRGFRFFRRYVFTNPRYTINYLVAFWRRGFQFRAQLLSEPEFITELKKGKSLIRLGDGEINLMLGLRNHYQIFSPVLQKAMFDIVLSYNNNSPYILSVPRFINCSNEELRGMGKLQVWLPLKVMFGMYFKKKLPYLDAHSFYYDEYFERTVGACIADKQIVLITRQATIDKQKNNASIPWGRVSYIAVPEQEALSSYESIKEKIEATLHSTKLNDVVLLFAMGPVGKQLAFEFAKRNVQSIDIGKVAEVFYTGESIAYIV